MLDVRATTASIETKRAAADALAALVSDPAPERIIPGAFEPGVADAVAAAVRRSVVELGHVRHATR
jgi:malate dehydrogenase (oxaloacetate-decarboxylating)